LRIRHVPKLSTVDELRYVSQSVERTGQEFQVATL
jgi:hypothetical protein